ncbi:protein Gawky isoform X2 [Aethina tumida]|uniref:protein Gawky isoform X2 n=1 Tax=Aethina tumida TaxID=116153 RepID=UPI00096AF0E1|nr:protein Gawky isoform X2 [Aethina tumida]
MMRAPFPSEPKSTFPTYQVPQQQESATMRGSAAVPPVQVAGAGRGGRAGPPSGPPPGPVAQRRDDGPAMSVITNGSSCRRPRTSGRDNSNVKMQSVTENCLLNYSTVTVPNRQRNGRPKSAAHNNSDKLDSKFGALSFGRDIPNKKSDDLEVLDAYDYCNSDDTSPLTILVRFCSNNSNLTDDNNTAATLTDLVDRFVATVTSDNDEDDVDSRRQSTRTNNDEHAPNVTKPNDAPVAGTRYSVPLRLRGGGESSLSTGTSNWGSPPSQQASNNNASSTSGWGSANPANQNTAGTQQWNNNANRPPTSNQGPTAQDANKVNANGQQPPTSQQSNNTSGWPNKTASGGTGTGPAPNATTPGSNNPPNNNNGPTTNTTKQQLEQLNNMREAIFSTEGWGAQHVNQDTNWDIPSSPEPMKMDGSGPSPWKPTVNNGTDLWEANLRNGGQPPPQPQQKTPWGHTPSTNIGGTWGEDDDTDTSNVWTGVPSGQQQWGGNTNNGAMWGGPKKDGGDWTASGAGGGGGGWGDPRSADPRQQAAAAVAAAAQGMDPREMRGGAGPGGAQGGGGGASDAQMRLMDPREQMRQLTAAGASDMRGDPRGITGRINAGGAEAFWSQSGHPSGPQHMHHQGKMPVGPGNGAGGWEEPSPPTQRRNMPPNYDDGTSLWGNPNQGGSHWKDLPTGAGMGGGGRGSGNGPPGMAQGGGGRLKPDAGPVWGHPGRNGGGSWDDVGPGGGAGGGGGWDDTVGPWAKQKMGGGGGGPLWGDSEIDWAHKQGKQQLTKEMIWNSKQFRMLAELGHKKEDIEVALRMRDMNYDEAMEMLGPLRRDGWGGRHDDHYDHSQFSGQRFPSGPGGGGGQMGFPPSNAGPNLIGNMNNSSASANNLINNIPPATVQKLLTGGSQGFGNSSASASGRTLQQNQPSTQQLRMLVQQIQMAVQAGYLNHQILNQPLAPQTLVLLNQLLQQIKTLQQLVQQQQIAQNQVINGKPTNNYSLQCSVLITKTKQQIGNLQNQIAAQQAIYVKQQNSMGGGPDIFKTSAPMHDSLNAMQSNFADLAIKDPQVSMLASLGDGSGGAMLSGRGGGGGGMLQNQQQSRLTQWISKDKEDGNEFSRAPGSASKPLVTSPNMNPLLSQSDGPWSSGRSGDTGWPDSGGGDSSNDVKDAQWSTPAQPSLTDLVPEFEPGKPWKGNQIKSIEDDPSITPGSVVRSPLSIPTIKDSEIFMNPSKSPPANDSIQPLTLNSSTWSFNPPSSTTSSAFTSPQNKLQSTNGGLADLNPSTAVTSELWAAPKSRPPPGLSAKGSLANGWSTGGAGSNIVGGTVSWGGGGQRSSGNWGGSPSAWLLLRNLTAQIDGSTLRTLCMQHGPLQNFHLYLHQGFALAKYSSQQEATKAKSALNNCVLGNTTILAENPSDWDASALLQQVASQQNSSGGWRGSAGKPAAGADTWSSGGWPNAPTSSLWANTPLDSADQSRATPSSLNSFLPNDLLGGESM